MSNNDFFEIDDIYELCEVLGLSERDAAKVEIRRNLVIKIKRVIEKKGWTHAKTAEEAGVGRTVITSVVNGNLEKISTDRLIDIAHNIGLKLTLKVA